MDAGTLGSVSSKAALGCAVMSWLLAIVRRSVLSRWALVGGTACIGVATAVLGWALVHLDPALREVAEVSARGRPWYERLAGLWGSSRPSLLLWTAMFAVAMVVATSQEWARRRGVLACGAGLLSALGAIVVTVGEPFRRLDIPATDGVGLTPILRHPAMLVHPPLLYAGQVLSVAVGIVSIGMMFGNALAPADPAAAHVGGAEADAGDGVRWTRRWTLAATALLATALTLGAWWAYAELGWGGFWAWDPVENAGLLPWLTGVTVLHAFASRAPRVASTASALGAVLAMAGVTLTRSGVGISVHTFAPNASVGRALSATLVVFTVVSGVALWRLWATARRPRRQELIQADSLPSSPWVHRLRRQPIIAVVVIAYVTVVVALGTGVPLVYSDRVVRGDFFALFIAPAALIVLIAIGCFPAAGQLPWPTKPLAGAVVVGFAGGCVTAIATHSPFSALVTALAPAAAVGVWTAGRKRRSFVAHTGVVVLLIGIAGSAAGAETSAWLRPGEAVQVQGWDVKLQSLTAQRSADRDRVIASIAVSGRGRRVVLHPSADRWDGWEQPLAETAAVTGVDATSLQVVLRRVVSVAENDGGDTGPTPIARLDLHSRPLLLLVWLGAALIASGCIPIRLRVPKVRRRRCR